MVNYVKGAELHAKMVELKEKALANINEAKEVLEPKLNAQGLTLTEGDNYSSIISDLKNMISIEKNIINGTLDKMNFVESGLFSINILPSNVELLNKNRAVFVEKGLLYIIEYDEISATITYKKIYKIDPLWKVANGSVVRIVKGYNNSNIFIYPEFGNTIISIYGEGLEESGPIYYNTINIGDLNHVIGLSIDDADVAFITEDRHYCRIYTFDIGKDYTMTYPYGEIIDVPLPFMGTCLCEGDINFIGTDTGAIFKYNPSTKEFAYFNDIMNNPSYEEHIVARRANPEDYCQILDLAKNHGRVIAATASNKLYLTYSKSKYEKDILLKDKFYGIELDDTMVLASLAINRTSADALSYISGLNSDLKAVAYTFTNEDELAYPVALGHTGVCQYVTIGVVDNGATIIQVYENTIKASEYYTQEEITNHNYKDYNYDLIGMNFASYEDGVYIHYPEFNPLFVPDKIVSEKDTTVVIGDNNNSKLFNFAITNDHKHWAIINMNDDIAINVRDIESGNNVFVMCGFFNDHILVSNYGYEWEVIELPYQMSLMGITFNKFHNKFYMVTTDLSTMVEYDPITKTISTIDIATKPTGTVIVSKIMSWGHNVFVVGKADNAPFVMKSTKSIDDGSALDDKMESVTFKYRYNLKNNVYECVCNLKDTVEIGDEVFAIFDTGIAWDPESEMAYDKTLSTGILVYQPKNSLETTDILIDNTGMNTFMFPMDPSVRISATLYLNHIVVAHPANKGYITPSGNLNVSYENIQNGRYYGLLVNATGVTSSEGYIHMIQNQVNSFSEYSYIISSDSWYNPTISESDLTYGKKTYQIKEFGLEHVDSEVDKNNNIDVYNPLYSDLINNFSGAVIYTTQYVMVTKGLYIYLSSDGIKWTKRNMPKNGDWRDIAYNGTYYMAVNLIDSDSGEVWYSKDLYTWTKDSTISGGFREIHVNYGTFYLLESGSVNNTKYYKATAPGQWLTVDVGTPINMMILPTCLENCNKYSPITFNKYDSNLVLYDGFCGPNGELTRGLYLNKDGIVVNATSLEESKNETILNSSRIGSKPTRMRKVVDEYGRIFFFLFNEGESSIYMSIINDKDDAMMHITRIDLPSVIDYDNAHVICYHSGKILIAGRRPMIITIDQEYPDIVESSFVVASGEVHRESLPFTPDHVFLFGAKSYNENDKMFSGEIHRTEEMYIDGLGHKVGVFYNNTPTTIKHRSDKESLIMENCFMFANNTLTDRHINYIAIKENHYK